MFRAIKLAYYKRQMERANEAYTSYQRQSVRTCRYQWRLAVAAALHQNLVQAERRYSYALNGWGSPC